MAFPQIDTPSGGPLTVADLDAARKHSTGSVRLVPAGCGNNGRWPERRVNWQPDFPDTVPTDYGWLDSCAPEGGIARDPVESMARYRQTASTVRWGIALAVVLAVVGYFARVFAPLA